jgi:hypothetical protein
MYIRVAPNPPTYNGGGDLSLTTVLVTFLAAVLVVACIIYFSRSK